MPSYTHNLPKLECHSMSDVSSWEKKLFFLAFSSKLHAQARFVSCCLNFHQQWNGKLGSDDKEWQEHNLQVLYYYASCSTTYHKGNNNPINQKQNITRYM